MSTGTRQQLESREPSFNRPTETEVDAQIRVLCRHPRLQGDLRSHLLRYLVRVQREGRYGVQPRPTGKQILSEFYEFAVRDLGIGRPKDPDVTGKKLVGELADALESYYESGPGLSDEVVVRIAGGRGSGYEPAIERRAARPAGRAD